MKKLIMFILLLLLMTPLSVLAVSDEPVVGDGFCDRSLGENRENSVDCTPVFNDYYNCVVSEDDCLDLKTHNEVILFLCSLIVVLFIFIIIKRNDN